MKELRELGIALMQLGCAITALIPMLIVLGIILVFLWAVFTA